MHGSWVGGYSMLKTRMQDTEWVNVFAVHKGVSSWGGDEVRQERVKLGNVEGRNVGWIHFKQSWLFEGENSKSDCTLERKNIMSYGWFWMYLNTYKIFYLDYLLYHSGNQRDGLKFYLCINLCVYFLFMQISLGRLWPSRQHWEASQSIVG